MFEHLDDDAPLEPTRSTRAAVERRATRLRRRRTIAPSVAIIVIIAIGLGAIAAAGHRRSNEAISVVATQPATTTTTPTSTSTPPPVPASLRLSIHVDAYEVAGGGKLSGYVEIVNPTRQPVDVSGVCGPKWAIGLAPPGEVPNLAFTTECRVGPSFVQPGTTRWPFSVDATYNECSPIAQPGVRVCASNGAMPPLPKGRYDASMVWSGKPDGLVDPEPVPVTVR